MNINKITLMGRLTADPELKMSQSNVPVLRFTVAVNRKIIKQNKDTRPTADFIDCVCFNKTAEFVSKYFKKGSVIIVFGSLQIENWKDKNGNSQRSPRVIVEEVLFGESKNTDKPEKVKAEPDYLPPNAATQFDFSSTEDDLPF